MIKAVKAIRSKATSLGYKVEITITVHRESDVIEFTIYDDFDGIATTQTDANGNVLHGDDLSLDDALMDLEYVDCIT